MCVYIYILIYYLFYSLFLLRLQRTICCTYVCVCVYNTFVFDDNLNEKRRQPIPT